MDELTADHFDAFYRAVWKRGSYPWQRRLVAQVLEDGRWPDVIDLPTGAGKTSTIDVALFALAARPDVFPRRIVFVIDRRPVVDQTAEHVQALSEALESATDGVVTAVRDRLLSLTASGRPLASDSLRGGRDRSEAGGPRTTANVGVPIGSEWARWPDQPTVLVSTVDQFGSRLLFRGYGVGRRMLPVHAGLAANDVLVLLDEVHLSRPLAKTLLDVGTNDLGLVAGGLPRRWQVVQMSATPAGSTGVPFRIATDDLADETLGPRLTAAKSARLRMVPDKGKPADEALAAAAARLVADLTDDQPPGVVGFVVNRVATARAVEHAIRGAGYETRLVTGRMRPWDRQRANDELVAAADPARALHARDSTLVVVATQCIEVGIDISFDSMVTEVAPVSALRQRFGRLDRRGDLARSGRVARALVVGLSSAMRPNRPDPVYGETAFNTWSELSRRFAEEPFDVGPLSDSLGASPQHGEFPLGADVEERDASILLPAHLDALVQTMPQPEAQPNVADFLHGPVEADTDVAIVWRRDAAAADSRDAGRITELLALLPPHTAEAMPVPWRAVRAWLRGDAPAPVSDVDAVSGDELAHPARAAVDRQVVRWRGPDDVAVIEPGDVRPGDTLVVPVTYGGISAATWDPTSSGGGAELDIAEEVAAGGPFPVIRLDADALAGRDEFDSDEAFVSQWIADHVEDGAWPASGNWTLASYRYRTSLTGELADGLAIVTRHKRPPECSLDGTDETNSFPGAIRPITLRRHLEGVGRLAREIGERCHLEPPLVADLELAGRLHDLGKIDARFQAMLHRSEVRAAAASEPIAKSSGRAGEWFGYPKGARHEYLSAALVAGHPQLIADANDPDLVAHLIVTHHGHARPWPMIVEDPQPVQVEWAWGEITLRGTSNLTGDTIAIDSAERFWRLVGRYGWHGLAWLETLLRLADHRCSEREASKGGDQ